MMKVITKILISLVFLLLCSVISGANGEENLLLTKSEKQAFDQFKSRVISKVPQDHMKQDIYLIRWLRARNFNVQQAENMLLENISWRKEYSLDTILSEDWSDIEELLPLDELAVDKSGSPIRAMDVESWNIRRVVLAGKGRRMYRYFLRVMEEPFQQVLHLQRLGQGNVTQWTLIVNLEGFNVISLGCALCLPVYAQALLSLENQYPGSLKELILINVPPSFRIVMDVLRPIFSPATRQVMKTFGLNRKEWRDYLLKEISPDQLGSRFGGTRSTSKSTS